MNDKILDDDDIIDLTDLLEEGDASPGKEKKAEGPSARTPANEPDSFDLGREISMEYDVSVEEIESEGEGLDMNADLSSGEEMALSPEEGGGPEFAVSGDGHGEVTFDFDDASPARAPEPEVQPAGSEPVLSGSDEAETFVIDEEGDLGDEVQADAPGETVEELLMEDVSLDFSDERVSESAPDSRYEEETPDAGTGDEEAIPVDEDGLPAGDVPMEQAGTAFPAEALDDLRQEIPAMLESVLRPLVSELVRETIASTREQLPGIIERVIREEIEKLKKLDS
jgi:hypothetical protein